MLKLTSFMRDVSGILGNAISLLLLGGLGSPDALSKTEPVFPGDDAIELRSLRSLGALLNASKVVSSGA